MRISLKVAGAFLAALALALWISYPFWRQSLVQALTGLASSDKQITAIGQRMLSAAFYYLSAWALLSGAALWSIGDAHGWRRLKEALWAGPEGGRLPFYARAGFLLAASTVTALFLMIHIKLYDPESRIYRVLYFEDGVFETLMVVLVFLSALMLAAAVWQLSRQERSRAPLYALGFLAVLGAGLFLYGGEEISWGQRLFHWQTPAWLARINVQDETNLHNVLNRSFDPFYQALVIVPLFPLASAWLAYRQRLPAVQQLVIPHASLMGMGLVIGFASAVFFHDQEMLEEMMAAMAFFYSLRIYSVARAQKTAAARVKQSPSGRPL